MIARDRLKPLDFRPELGCEFSSCDNQADRLVVFQLPCLCDRFDLYGCDDCLTIAVDVLAERKVPFVCKTCKRPAKPSTVTIQTTAIPYGGAL